MVGTSIVRGRPCPVLQHRAGPLHLCGSEAVHMQEKKVVVLTVRVEESLY
jgi:hypothetical protein